MGLSIDTLNTDKTKAKVERVNGNSVSDFLNQDIEITRWKFSNTQKEKFYESLKTMLSAGLPISRTLEIIIEETQKKKVKSVVSQIYEDLISGKSMADAMSSSKQFTKYECVSVQIGEELGRMPEIVDSLHDYYKRSNGLRKTVISALTYPIMVLLVAIGAIVFMLGYVVPMFEQVFAQFGNELPPLTAFIVSLSETVQEKFLIILIAMVFLAASIWGASKIKSFNELMVKAVIKIPIIGIYVIDVELSRFTNAMKLLLMSQYPLVDSIRLAAITTSYNYIKNELEAIATAIESGKGFAESIAKVAFVPSRYVSLIRIGEEVNSLDSSFQTLAEQYSQILTSRTKALTQFLEPILILMVGAIIAVILVAMYLPMLSLDLG